MLKAIYVEWIDHAGEEENWQDVDKIVHTLPMVKTVGWLLNENSQCMTVGLSYGTRHSNKDEGPGEEVLAYIIIHKPSIRKRKWIKI